MAVTITLYNHTKARFASGANAEGDTYRVALYSAATFDAADTTLAGITGTQLSTGNGYTAGGATVPNVSVATVDTNAARFTGDPVVWTADGGPIAASFAVLYNDTDTDDPPVAFIDFDGEESAGDGTDFRVNWNADGIVTFTAPA